MSCVELQTKLEAGGKNECFSNASSAREKGKRFSFDNRTNKTICRVRIDDCLITGKEVRKCDYLFNVHEIRNYYLVEFKGGKADEAVMQIVNTFNIVNEKIKAEPRQYKGVVVSSSVPAGTESAFRKLQEKYFKEKRLRITKTHQQHIEMI